MPIDAPVVYSFFDDGDDDVGIQGGTGQDLAEQVVSVIKDKLGFNSYDISYIQGQFEFRFTSN